LNPDDFPEWLRPHLPGFGADATRVASRLPAPQQGISPDIARRINQLVNGTQGRTVGALQPGAHPYGLSDTFQDIGNLARSAVSSVTPLRSLEDWIGQKTGGVSVQDAKSVATDPDVVARQQLADAGDDPLLAAIVPGAAEGLVGKGKGGLPRLAKAAIQLPDGSIHWATNHAMAIEAAQTAGALPARMTPKALKTLENSTEGFVDETGNFLTRDQTTARLKALGSKLGGPGFSSEELQYLNPKTKGKFVADQYELPHYGTRSYDESFPQPAPRAVADSVADEVPRFVPGSSIAVAKGPTEMQRALASLDNTISQNAARVADRATSVIAGKANGLDDAKRLLRTMQHNSGAVNMPRVTAVDPEKAAHMAQVYAGLPAHQPEAKAAYDALNSEVANQYQSIIDNGHTIHFTDSDPYKTSKEMIADVRDNRNLNVFRTQGDVHPFMTPEQNDKFRAVHDWLAHAGEGHSFGPKGEENAYRVHSSTLSPLAQRALATETRGQNSWVNYGPNAHLPASERPFAQQKAALWPAEYTGDYHEMPETPPVAAAADSVAANVPAFYSRLGAAIDNAPMKKGTAAQWQAHLGKNVSAGERDWTGVDNFLKNATGPVTQDQVKSVFDKGKIELGQTTLAKGPQHDAYEARLAELNRRLDSTTDQYGNVLRGQERDHRNTTLQIRALQDAGPERDATKFEQYTEPGGTNYREKLITLKTPQPQGWTAERLNTPDAGFNHWQIRDANGNPVTKIVGGDEEGAIRKAAEGDTFKSTHFGEPNILTHLRMKDRETPSGEKVLHLEELQSDWHQKGRKEGYRRGADYTIPLDGEYRALVHKNSDIRQAGGTPDPADVTRAQALEQELIRSDKSNIPDAPFKKTEDWQLLGMKHAIHDAVHGGYDRVAWTPGDLQNARYDLSKQVDEARYNTGTGNFGAYQHGRLVHEGTYAPEALESVIGKEAADRILHNPTSAFSVANGHTVHALSGEDLKIGGSGMKGFYDNMLPKNLAKYFKQLGLPAPEIEPTEMHFNKPGELSVQNFPSFKITPELRKLVLERGQPLWAGVGAAALGAGVARRPRKKAS
jgi:hypothetical protein